MSRDVCPRCYAPAVRVHVHSERLEPGCPTQAARDAAMAGICELPQTRDILVLAIELGVGPGLEVAPWTLHGVAQAARDAGMQARFDWLSTKDRVSGIGRKLGLPALCDESRSVTLAVRGVKRPCRIPVAWFGKHLCVVVPCVHIHRKSTRLRYDWDGPAAEALRVLGRQCVAATDRIDATIGAAIVDTVFASTTFIIDAGWWGPLRDDEPVCPVLIGLDRCISLGSSQPTRGFTRPAAASVDHWLAERLGLVARGTAGALVVVERGSAARRSWPRAPDMERARPGLAGKTMAALWSSGRGRARLPPSVPGAFGRLWRRYADPVGSP